MKACIYTRTALSDKSHNQAASVRQVEDAKAVAHERNLSVSDEHVFTDIECEGHLPAAQWSLDGDAFRPALSAMITSLEEGHIERVIVRQVERLGTTSETLTALRSLCEQLGVRILLTRKDIPYQDEPREAFATQILKPVILLDSPAEVEKKERQREAKLAELKRLQGKIGRLEAEIAELSV